MEQADYITVDVPKSWDVHRIEVKIIIRNVRKHLDFAVYTNHTDLHSMAAGLE